MFQSGKNGMRLLPAKVGQRRSSAINVGIVLLISCVALLGGQFWPQYLSRLTSFIATSFIDIWPVLTTGLLLSAWVTASGTSSLVAAAFRGHPLKAIFLAAGIGAVTPVCGVAALPMLTGLLAAGIPLAPVMAFWVSAPVTDPAMFAATWAVLGPVFAIGKSLAAFGIGLFAGIATHALSAWPAIHAPLRSRWFESAVACKSTAERTVLLRLWRDPARLPLFYIELFRTSRLVAICLAVAFAAEFILRDLVPAAAITSQLAATSDLAIPLAVTLGAPLYLDGYAALPLARALLDLGVQSGAIMAFLVAGSSVSIWGILAVLPVLRGRILVLLLALAVTGSAASGYAYQWLTTIDWITLIGVWLESS